jgi:Ca2+-binding EF-hand superfamily protein
MKLPANRLETNKANVANKLQYKFTSIQKAFRAFDKDKDNVVDLEEFSQGVEELGL